MSLRPFFSLLALSLLAACDDSAQSPGADTDTILGSAGGASVQDDTDADGLADSADNCPVVSNPTQSDEDGNGLGDACDLVVRMQSDLSDRVLAGRINRAALAVAEVVNHTDQPQAFLLWTEGEGMSAELSEGIIEPGELKVLYVDVDAREQVAGSALVGAAHLMVGDRDLASLDLVSAVLPPPPPATCTYSFKRDYVQAISGEGGTDPALELDGYVKTRVVTPSGSTYSNTYTNSNMKAGTTNNSDVVLTTQSVTSGTVVTLNWDAEVRERDTTSADDIGADGEGLTFTCSSTGSVAYGSVVIDVGGSVGVGVKVTW